jgi:hypothetical protein
MTRASSSLVSRLLSREPDPIDRNKSMLAAVAEDGVRPVPFVNRRAGQDAALHWACINAAARLSHRDRVTVAISERLKRGYANRFASICKGRFLRVPSARHHTQLPL